MADPISYPVEDIHLVLRACNPGEPLPPEDPRRADFRALRGDSVVEQFRRILAAPPGEGDLRHRVLCGYRGCGKSTELLQLKQWADDHGFLAVHAEVDREIGLIALQFSDLYLLAAMAIADALQAADVEPPREQLERIQRWFAEVIREESESVRSELTAEAGAELGAGVPFLGKLVAKFFSSVKAGAQQAETVRQRLRSFPDTLIDLTNDLVEAANGALAARGKPEGLLVLFDNLDRYEPGQIDQVLVRSSTLMRRLRCHVVYTIPINLEYDPISGPIQDAYGLPLVLPMLALRRRDQPWAGTVAATGYEPGAVAQLRGALARRIAVDDLFDQSGDVDLLIRMSGGCVRDLLHLVTLAYQHAGDTFSHESVVAAIGAYRASLVRGLTGEDYARLAQVARREPTPRDALTRRLLFYRYLLAYEEDGEPWMDVHPLVIEIEEFQRALSSQTRISEG